MPSVTTRIERGVALGGSETVSVLRGFISKSRDHMCISSLKNGSRPAFSNHNSLKTMRFYGFQLINGRPGRCNIFGVKAKSVKFWQQGGPLPKLDRLKTPIPAKFSPLPTFFR
jgi:hypothetical protein